eukprot:m.143028 g.143028  ORF g.143028 m.143028 type:complete len:244 (+) comp38375_c0_seq1:1129-1860(+)
MPGFNGRNGKNGNHGLQGIKGQKGEPGYQDGQKREGDTAEQHQAKFGNETKTSEVKKKAENCQPLSEIAYAKLYLGDCGGKKISMNEKTEEAFIPWLDEDAIPGAKLINLDKREDPVHLVVTISGIYTLRFQIVYLNTLENVDARVALSIRINSKVVSRSRGEVEVKSFCGPGGCLYSSLQVTFTDFIEEGSNISTFIDYNCEMAKPCYLTSVFVGACKAGTHFDVVLLRKVSKDDWDSSDLP